MKKVFSLLAAACLFLVCAPMFGQSGCLDSPENPTAILAVAGSAGAVFVAVRDRLRRRK